MTAVDFHSGDFWISLTVDATNFCSSSGSE